MFQARLDFRYDFGGDFKAILGRFWTYLGWIWGAKMDPKSTPKLEKNDAKINQNLYDIWDGIFAGFWTVFEAKMEPSWLPNRLRDRC